MSAKECNARYWQTDGAKEAYKRRQDRNRAIVCERLTTGCVDCGEKDLIVLEFDHVRDEKVKAISRLLANPISVKKLNEEMDKCDVVCSNCHKRRTAKRHGGWFKSTWSLTAEQS